MLKKFDKHIQQIKTGGTVVIIKKLLSFIYLILQIPIYLISIPLIILIRLIKPWYLIRWQQLDLNRIGHSLITELYCCEREAGINTPPQKRYIDFFYLTKYICNKQLERMWRRSLFILPTWLLLPLYRVNRLFGLFISGGKEHEIGTNINRDRDVHNLIEKFSPHIKFTSEEESKGKKILNKFGVPEGAKFVCLAIRDSSYLSRNQNYENSKRWSYHNYRDGDVDNYVLAAEELAKRGYYVFRMGSKVLKPLKSSNSKVVDYANSGMRTDFMDIYLGAKCFFCVSNTAGFEVIPHIFRRPIVSLCMPLGYLDSGNEKFLIITKHHISKKNKKKLTISEIFSSNVALGLESDIFELNDVELEENNQEEIKDLVIEMDERLNRRWKDTEEDILLQKKFWSIFVENIKKLSLKKPLHGKIKARHGAKFLRENKNWIK